MILLSAQSFGIWFLVFTVVPLAVFLSIFIPLTVIKNKYTSFVLNHSLAIRKLLEINKFYHFKRIPNVELTHSYDNENFYDNISCKDYLIYQLVYTQKSTIKNMKDADDNKELFNKYNSEIASKCVMGKYDTEELLKNGERLKKYEEKLFLDNKLLPTTSFYIHVRLFLTNINGVHLTSKRCSFDSSTIRNVIYMLNQKRGDFYLNEDIWQAICRVERGKVTNKMRFAIYQRDNNRCRKCGRRTGDLEIDHIIPISKGGKSEYSNLQTLCHRCNVKKGSNIEF